VVTSVTSTTDTSAAAAAMKKSVGLNKDDFLKLFIAQLQYQDPLKPQDPSAMLDQLSQLSLVEQSYNSTTALNNLLAAQKDATNLNSISFIGKEVKANGNAASFDGTTPAALQYSLPVPTASGTVTISDATGRVVRTAELGAQSAGDAAFVWDGRDNTGALLPVGGYSFAIKTVTASGTNVVATPYTTGRIDGVNLSGTTPLLNVGAVSVSLTDVLSIRGV